MSIGPDLKEAMNEIGVTALIVNKPLITEKVQFVLNKQVTKPFIREFFTEIVLVYDTAIESGDTLQIGTIRYLVMNKTPSYFEDAIIKHTGVLYKANAVGYLQRQDVSRGTNLQKVQTWLTISGENPVDVLMTEALYDNKLVAEELGELGFEKHEIYIPNRFGFKIQDRFYIDADSYYRVITVKKRKYQNIDVCEIDVDTR